MNLEHLKLSSKVDFIAVDEVHKFGDSYKDTKFNWHFHVGFTHDTEEPDDLMLIEPALSALSRHLCSSIKASATANAVNRADIQWRRIASILPRRDPYDPDTLISQYPRGWVRPINVNHLGMNWEPQCLVKIGPSVYCVVEATIDSILLDRPLDYEINSGLTISVGSVFDVNFEVGACKCYCARLALPYQSPGFPQVSRGTIHQLDNRFFIRRQTIYDSAIQGFRTTIDFLVGFSFNPDRIIIKELINA